MLFLVDDPQFATTKAGYTTATLPPPNGGHRCDFVRLLTRNFDFYYKTH